MIKGTYIVQKVKFRRGVVDGDTVFDAFKGKGAHVVELTKDDPKLQVEGFLSSTSGCYVYLLEVAKDKFLVRSTEFLRVRASSIKKYVARDELGLKRLLLSLLS